MEVLERYENLLTVGASALSPTAPRLQGARLPHLVDYNSHLRLKHSGLAACAFARRSLLRPIVPKPAPTVDATLPL